MAKPVQALSYLYSFCLLAAIAARRHALAGRRLKRRNVSTNAAARVETATRDDGEGRRHHGGEADGLGVGAGWAHAGDAHRVEECGDRQWEGESGESDVQD